MSGEPLPVAPAPVSASLAHATEVLTITFDQEIDVELLTAEASQFSVTDGVATHPGVSYVDIVGSAVIVQLNLPGAVPFELTCRLASGAGVVVGVNGLAVAPFSGMPVAIS